MDASGAAVPATGRGPWRQRSPALLLAADACSAFGSWIDFLAILTLAAWQFGVSAWGMAVVSAASLLPGMLAGPALGRACDRGDARHWLLASLAGRAGVTVLLLAGPGAATFLVLVGVRSVFAAVAPPAIQVLAVRTVDESARPRFYAALNVVNSAAKIVAPALGTVLASAGGEPLALWTSVVASAAAAVLFAALTAGPDATATAGVAAPAQAPATARAAAPSPTRSPAPAPRMGTLLWVAATQACFVFMVGNLLPLVLQRAGHDKALLGVLVGCSGAGNVVGGLWLARRGAAARLRGALREMLWPAWGQAVGFGALGALLAATTPAQAAVLLPAAFFVIGICTAMYAVALNVHVATHHAARVGATWGVLQAWQNAMVLLAPLAGAVVLERWGGPALFGCAWAVAAVSYGALAARQRARRRTA